MSNPLNKNIYFYLFLFLPFISLKFIAPRIVFYINWNIFIINPEVISLIRKSLTGRTDPTTRMHWLVGQATHATHKFMQSRSKSIDFSHSSKGVVRSISRKLNRATTFNTTRVRKKCTSKMTKRLETVATMACMKTLLMLFNCVFWVREGCFIWCNPPLTCRFKKACYLGIPCTQLLHNMLSSRWRVDVLLSECFFFFFFLFEFLFVFIILRIFIQKSVLTRWRNVFQVFKVIKVHCDLSFKVIDKSYL